MFIESPRYTERFGAVRINAVQRVSVVLVDMVKNLLLYEKAFVLF